MKWEHDGLQPTFERSVRVLDKEKRSRHEANRGETEVPSRSLIETDRGTFLSFSVEDRKKGMET